MAYKQKYDKPPITEAVAQLRLSEPLDDTSFDRVKSALRDRHNSVEPIHQFTTQYDLQNTSVSNEHEEIGCKFVSNDGAENVTVTKSEITPSRLAPYPGWERFSKMANSYFDLWNDASETSPNINRIGLRYINRIDIPYRGNPNLRIEDYFSVSVNMPDPEGTIYDYLIRMVVPTSKKSFKAIIHAGSVKPHLVGHGSFLLDIDIFCTPFNGDYSDLNDTLDVMRGLKNEQFESFITDKTRELFT